MNKNNVRKITQGAMMLSIIAVFLIINLQTAGLLELYAVWLLPLPFIFYQVQYGFKAAIILSIAALIMSFLLGSIMTLFYVTTSVVIGLVYGYGVSKDKDNAWLIFFTTVVTAISLFLEMYAFAAFFGYDLAAETHEIVQALKNIEGLVIPSDLESLVLGIYPVALIFMSFLQSLVVHMLAILLLKRLKIKTRKMKDLSNYRLPLWAGVLSLVGLFAGTLINIPEYRQYLMLVTTTSIMVLLVDAYIVVVLFARRMKMKWLPMLSVLSIVFLPSLGIYVFIGLGLLDSLTDFRQRILKL